MLVTISGLFLFAILALSAKTNASATRVATEAAQQRLALLAKTSHCARGFAEETMMANAAETETAALNAAETIEKKDTLQPIYLPFMPRIVGCFQLWGEVQHPLPNGRTLHHRTSCFVNFTGDSCTVSILPEEKPFFATLRDSMDRLTSPYYLFTEPLQRTPRLSARCIAPSDIPRRTIVMEQQRIGMRYREDTGFFLASPFMHNLTAVVERDIYQKAAPLAADSLRHLARLRELAQQEYPAVYFVNAADFVLPKEHPRYATDSLQTICYVYDGHSDCTYQTFPLDSLKPYEATDSTDGFDWSYFTDLFPMAHPVGDCMEEMPIYKDPIARIMQFFSSDYSGDSFDLSRYRQSDAEAQYVFGAYDALQTLNYALRYPQDAMEQNISGTVVVALRVEADGVVSERKVRKSLWPSCDAAALAATVRLRHFFPALKNGRPVASWHRLPVRFVIR